jgi:hypothetical protein
MSYEDVDWIHLAQDRPMAGSCEDLYGMHPVVYSSLKAYDIETVYTTITYCYADCLKIISSCEDGNEHQD